MLCGHTGADRNLIKIATRYILGTFWSHRGETLFQPGTFTTYKPFPSFCAYAHIAITRAARFTADPIAVFDGPFVIIIQGRREPRSLYHSHITSFVLSFFPLLTNLPLTVFIVIYFSKIIYRDIYLNGDRVIPFAAIAFGLKKKRKQFKNERVSFPRCVKRT